MPLPPAPTKKAARLASHVFEAAATTAAQLNAVRESLIEVKAAQAETLRLLREQSVRSNGQ